MEIVKKYDVDVTRVAEKTYRATAPSGATLDFGVGEGLLSPVELLLAAVAGCASVDLDVVTSRRSEPEVFDVHVEADRVDEDGAARLSAVRVSFDVAFPADAPGQQAQSLITRLLQLSKDKDCTVSRTVEHATDVEFNLAQS